MVVRSFHVALIAVAPMLLVPAVGRAQTVPDYGFTWATVTHAGNRPASPDKAPQFYPPHSEPAFVRGRVDYEYRIATTEVTVSQWLEFVQAYGPYYTGFRANSSFTGPYIVPTPLDPSEPAGYVARPGTENWATTMNWHMAARYVNWLHNGKAPQQEAFESGVYDASLLVQNPDGTWPIPPARSADARFWIPSIDEWTKAVHYDPNHYGDGLEGYWLRPNGSNDPLIPGYPDQGGQTLAGLGLPPLGPVPTPPPVGAYPNVTSPWGLLDASGGGPEWPDSGPGEGDVRHIKGGAQFSEFDPTVTDRLDWVGTGIARLASGSGLRIASVVPSPSSATVFLLSFLVRRRCNGIQY